MTASPGARPFFDRIQALRGLGALLVAGWHYSGWALHDVVLLPHTPWETAGPLQNAAGRIVLASIAGHAALMLFFVVSGYVLRVALEYGPQELGRAAGRFFIHRFFRIYPIVIVATLLHFAVAQFYPDISKQTGPLDFWFIFKNLSLLEPTVNGTFWALQVELLMAPVIFLLYFLEQRFGPRMLLWVALISTPLSFTGDWALWRPLSHNFFAFIVGMLIPTIGRRMVSALSKANVRWLAALAITFLFLPGAIFGFYSRFSAIFEVYGAALLLTVATMRADVSGLALLDRPLMQKLGFASGSYYVLHVATFPFGQALFAWLIPSAWSAAFPLLVGLLVLGLWLIAIAPLMWFSYLAIEAPGIDLGRRLAPSTPRGRPRVTQPGPP